MAPSWNPPCDVGVHAAGVPHRPAFFYPRAGRWRWRSWSWTAAAIRWATVGLAPVPAGATVGFDYHPGPRGLVLDLGIAASGRISAPGTAPPVEAGSAGHPVDSWIGHPSRGARDGTVALGDPPNLEAVPGTVGADPGPLEVVDRGGGWLVVDGPAGARGSLGAAELAGGAGELAARLGSGAEREIALVAGPLDRWSERAYLAWAIGVGAALVLVPRPSELAADLLWARPTVAALGGDDLVAARRRLEAEIPSRRLTRRLRRLRALVVSPPVPAGEDTFWRRLGVELVDPPPSPFAAMR